MKHKLSAYQHNRSAHQARAAQSRHVVLVTFLCVVLSLIIGVTWLGYRAAAALSKISDAPSDRQTGLLPAIPFLGQQKTDLLQGEEDNRINILLLGMGGSGHPGGQLTDTIMVMSFAPRDGKVALLSIPRDLYVQISGDGYGKLNSAHAVGEQGQSGQGPAVAKATVSKVLQIPLHYYVRIDFQGFTKLVDALDGVDVNVEKALADPLYPDEKLEGYSPFYLKAGQTHMNGALALKYARSRETTSDFDRARRQQQLLGALRAKALSLGTLTNPKKMTEILEIAGNHVRTDLAVWEMERFFGMVRDINTDTLVNKVLDTKSDGPLTSRTDERAGYIIVPRKGNFSELQLIARNLLSGEATGPATIAIRNGSGGAGLGGKIALLLRGYGYTITDITSVKDQATSQLVQKSMSQFTDTSEFLAERFDVKATQDTTGKQAEDFILTIGQDYARLVEHQ